MLCYVVFFSWLLTSLCQKSISENNFGQTKKISGPIRGCHEPIYSLSLMVFILKLFPQEYMPLPPSEEEEKSTEENSEPKLQFSYVECLIFAFHQLAKKVDTNSTFDTVHSACVHYV